MAIPWTKKYAPEKAEDLLGQEIPITRLRSFLEHYKKEKKKAALVNGPNGCGKTSAAYILAKEMDLEIVEINASDFRNKEAINSLVGAAMGQRSLFSKGKLILVDEIDGLSGKKDRGGIQALSALIDKSTFPVIMTCTDPYEKKLKPIKKKSEAITFNPLDYTTIFSVLHEIARKENISYEEFSLKSLSRMANGDARAAINDMQTVSASSGKVDKETISVLGERDHQESIKDVLVRIFKTTDPDIARQALWNVKEMPEEIMLWIDENLPQEYLKPADLDRAYESLSRADVFHGRIRRWQHWGFLVTINALISAGVALAKDKRYSGFREYVRTKRLLMIWMARQKYAKKKSIAEKLAGATHCSSSEAIQTGIDFMRPIFRNDPNQAERISEEIDLSFEEKEWLRK